MSTAHQRGIHQLLQAEKKALDQVNESKKRRAQRLKQARNEAQNEIEAFRQQQENKFSEYEKTFTLSKEDVERLINEETDAEIKRMGESVLEHKESVLARLMGLVCDIRPEMHHNLTLKRKIEDMESNRD